MVRGKKRILTTTSFEDKSSAESDTLKPTYSEEEYSAMDTNEKGQGGDIGSNDQKDTATNLSTMEIECESVIESDKMKSNYSEEKHLDMFTDEEGHYGDIESEDERDSTPKRKTTDFDDGFDVEIEEIKPNFSEEEYSNMDTSREGHYIDIGSKENKTNSSKSAEPIRSDAGNQQTEDQTLSFKLSADTWQTIKPSVKTYAGKGSSKRRMSGDWTRIFSTEISKTHPGCVLAFKNHNVKMPKSRKLSARFLSARAECNGQLCSAIFKMYILMEPLENDDVTVHYTTSGRVMHVMDDVNKRPIAGKQRAEVAEELRKTTTAEYYYENLTKANTKQLDSGNYTSVPSHAVLRKIVSETLQKEYFHMNIVGELQVLKESYADDQYIHDIGLDPFTVILYSKAQIALIKQLVKENALNIYVDSTGTVIGNITGQKKPYLYSIVVKPKPDLPPVSVADMITTEHTIPRIELLLSTLKRAVTLEGGNMAVNKIETDFSFALIQACLKQFSLQNLKSYLVKCSDICLKTDKGEDFTCLHICAAHMMNNFVRSLKQKPLNPLKNKSVRETILRAFAKLQNALNLDEAKNIYEDICRICLTELKTNEVELSLAKLNKMSYHDKGGKEEEEEEKDVTEENYLSPGMDNIQYKTIKNASPFTQIFKNVRDKVTSEETGKSTSKNEVYCPDIITILEDKFIPTIPLWSGMTMNYVRPDDGTLVSRDTNVPVENWFKFLKHDKKMLRMRPAKFVISLKTAVDGRLLEQKYPLGRGPKTKKRKQKPTSGVTIDLEEEVWGAPPKKKPRYHPPKLTTRDLETPVHETEKPDIPKPTKPAVSKPTKPAAQKATKTAVRKTTLPKVMRWGGREANIILANTCSIDNGLTIIHLHSRQNEHFERALQNHPSDVYNTLASAMTMMTEENYPKAKLIWVNLVKNIKGDVQDLYGDESDLMFHHLSALWVSTVKSRCDNPECPSPYKEREEHGILYVGLDYPFDSIQTLIDIWLDEDSPCLSTLIDLDSIEGSQLKSAGEKICSGRRQEHRHVETAPILIMRVYEHCLSNRISVDKILKGSTHITVTDKQYDLAGITLHKGNHYCAIVKYNNADYWYDGLKGKLSKYEVRSTTEWFPSHLVYCESLQSD